MSLSNLTNGACGLQRYQYSAPEWLDGERFDLRTKVPEGTTTQDFILIQRNLPRQRFGLGVHRETKKMTAHDLVVMKNGPKLKEAPPAPSQFQKGKDGFPILPTGRAGVLMIPKRARWQAVGASTDQIVRTLAGQAGAPVNDSTGLTGKYDFTLSWNPEVRGFGGEPLALAGVGEIPAPDADTAETLFDAIQNQLGLRLEKKRVSVDMLVVDHVEKMPTAN